MSPSAWPIARSSGAVSAPALTQNWMAPSGRSRRWVSSSGWIPGACNCATAGVAASRAKASPREIRIGAYMGQSGFARPGRVRAARFMLPLVLQGGRQGEDEDRRAAGGLKQPFGRQVEHAVIERAAAGGHRDILGAVHAIADGAAGDARVEDGLPEHL